MCVVYLMKQMKNDNSIGVEIRIKAKSNLSKND